MCGSGLLNRLWASMTVWAIAGCTGAPTRALGPPLGEPDGVVCGQTTCEGGTACCLGDGSCLAVAASGNVECPDEYLSCDGPEDCPGSWCCLHQGAVGRSPYAACDGFWDGGAGCPVGSVPVCKSAPQCEYFIALPVCSGIDASGFGSAGAVSVCGP